MQLIILSSSSRITASSPAYRATLLNHKWAEVKSPLTFPFQSVSGLTEPIPNFAKFSGRKVGLRTEISDIQKMFVLIKGTISAKMKLNSAGFSLFYEPQSSGKFTAQTGQI